MTQQPNTPAPVEKAAPADAMSKIRGVQAFLESTWRTNSRDATDWRDDVAIAIRTLQSLLDGMAAQQAAQPVAGEPVAWRYIPSAAWRDYVLTEERELADLARQHGCNVEPLYTAAPAPVGLVPPGVWQPIETAPLNGDVLLLWWGGEVVLGHWNPHNTHDAAWWPRGAWRGVGQTSKSMWVAPTHWMYPPHAPGKREAAHGIKAGKDVAK